MQYAGKQPTVTTIRRQMARGSLLLRFSLLSFALLAFIGAGLGWILQRQMEHTALVQQADEISVVVEGELSRNLTKEDLKNAGSPGQRARWETLAHRLLRSDRHLVRIKAWDRSGRVVYSNNARQIGKHFPIDEDLGAALAGRRSMDVSSLTQSENALDRQGHSKLLETYIPIRTTDGVIGAYEAYSDLDALDAQLNEGSRVLWGSVAIGFILLFASLFAIVRDASRRLVRQMRAISSLELQAREAETLRQVDQMKDDFISSVSHELRRPLASIKGYTGSLLLPEVQWNPETSREFLQVIDEEADHLSILIDNLLDLARLGSGSLQLHKEPLHLRALAEQLVSRIRSQSQLPPHPYTIEFPERFPYVEADPSRMTQLLLNLLENAAKYSPSGAPISVTGKVEEGSVVVSVTDRGQGLTPEHASHVFDRFYRVDTGLTRATEGTGLGLAICRGVVEAHGGYISVQSTPGEGSTFTFSLPAPRDGASAGADSGRTPVRGASGASME